MLRHSPHFTQRPCGKESDDYRLGHHRADAAADSTAYANQLLEIARGK
jgi:hypothetical protein